MGHPRIHDDVSSGPWDYITFTDREDAQGQLATGCFGDTTLHEIFQPGRVVDLEDYQRMVDPEFDEPRGLTDYVGNAGLHPDRTPVDVFMDNEAVGLSVGYAMLADGDDSYLSREGGLTF